MFCPPFPPWEPSSSTRPWDSSVLLRLPGLNMRLNPVKTSIYTQKILARFSSSFSCPRQASYVSSLLINPATYKSGAICFFLGGSPCLLCHAGPGTRCEFHFGKSQACQPTTVLAIQKEPKGHPAKLQSHGLWDPTGPQTNPRGNRKGFPKRIHKDRYNLFKKTGVVYNMHRSPLYFST